MKLPAESGRSFPSPGERVLESNRRRNRGRMGVRERLDVGAIALIVGLMLPATAGAEPALERFRSADEPLASERVITESEWASELVFALGLSEALPEEPEAAELFGLLCADSAERVTAAGGRRVAQGAPLRFAADTPPTRQPGDPVRLVVTLPATALYALTVNGVGPQRWAIDRRLVGHLDPSPLGVSQATQIVPLRAGPHELSAYLSHAARVDRVELAAHRPLCISPADGWRARRPLTFAALARTLVQSLGFERQLPVGEARIAIEGEHYASAAAWGGRTNRRLAQPASGGAWATAVSSPAEFTYRAQVDEPGLFSLMVRVHGGGQQIWSIDGRYRMTVKPGEGAESFAWTHAMTLHLDRGEHVIRALVPTHAGIDTLHLVERQARDVDFVAVLQDAGFDVGVPGQPVTQTDAYRQLAHPLFSELASDFRARAGGEAQRTPAWILEAELEGVPKLLARSGLQ